MTAKVKEKPILFSGPMVRAILEDRKTQTRRVVKNPKSSGVDVQQAEWIAKNHNDCWSFKREIDKQHSAYGKQLACNSIAIDVLRCPYGEVGDRLWCRENFAYWNDKQNAPMVLFQADEDARLIIDDGRNPKWLSGDVEFNPLKHTSERIKWKPSIHMPRWASRITLEITGVRVERLQDISEEDAKAEGAPDSHSSIDAISREFGYPDFSRSYFAQLWQSINGPESWAANPWVWIVEFKRIEP